MTAGRIWVFDEGQLEDALVHYEREAIGACPGRDERFRLMVAALRDFLQSECADKLIPGAAREKDET